METFVTFGGWGGEDTGKDREAMDGMTVISFWIYVRDDPTAAAHKCRVKIKGLRVNLDFGCE